MKVRTIKLHDGREVGPFTSLPEARRTLTDAEARTAIVTLDNGDELRPWREGDVVPTMNADGVLTF